jgi:hypothetical protein
VCTNDLICYDKSQIDIKLFENFIGLNLKKIDQNVLTFDPHIFLEIHVNATF